MNVIFVKKDGIVFSLKLQKMYNFAVLKSNAKKELNFKKLHRRYSFYFIS